MAAIMVLDEMSDLTRRVGELESEIKELSEAGQALSREQEILESEYAARFTALAERIHGLAGELEKAGANGHG
jgi:cell division protein ZapA (FtsZ GTPase activity inhibitor)